MFFINSFFKHLFFWKEDIKNRPLYDWGILAGTLLVPALIGVYTFQENKRAEQRNDAVQKSADKDRQHEVMTDYLDRMTTLILDRELRELQDEEDDVRIVARAITLSAARRLDAEGRGQLLKFLYEAKLVGRCDVKEPVPGTKVKPLTEQEKENKCVGPVFPLNSVKLETASFGETPIPNMVGMSLNEATLDNANLPKIKLVFASLKNAKLANANLLEASLAGADLEGAELAGAYLQKTILSGAIFKGATMYNALLQCADLRGATLVDAELRGANLDNADLDGATLGTLQGNSKDLFNERRVSLQNSILTNVDLSNIKNIESVNLRGAIYNSKTIPPTGYSSTQLSTKLGMKLELTRKESFAKKEERCNKIELTQWPPKSDSMIESQSTSLIDLFWKPPFFQS